MKVECLRLPKAKQFASECAAIHANAFYSSGGRAWTADEFESLLARTTIMLLRTDYSFLLADIFQNEAEILALAVHPDKQNQGSGGLLLESFFTECIRAGVSRCVLEVAEDNSAALRLYHRFNFEIISIRKGYFKRKNKFTSALVMKKCFISQ